MTFSEEQIQGLVKAVALWRLQENIFIAFYCFYVYYVLTTIREEVYIILPQRWNRGKALYMTIRYGVLLYIAIELIRDHRTHLLITPEACKTLDIIYSITRNLVVLTCDFSLALCLGALLHVKSLYLGGIIMLSCGVPLVNHILSTASTVKYPAEPVPALDTELGYPCYVISAEQSIGVPVTYAGRDIRVYLGLATTTLLAVLGLITLVIRYKGQSGRLMQVIRRDGGLHYLSLIVLRLTSALLFTPAILLLPEMPATSVYIVALSVTDTIVPILAQRLLINMRGVDYMGSEPIASKLLFAPPPPGSEDDLNDAPDVFEVTPGPSGGCHQRRRVISSEHVVRESLI